MPANLNVTLYNIYYISIEFYIQRLYTLIQHNENTVGHLYIVTDTICINLINYTLCLHVTSASRYM